MRRRLLFLFTLLLFIALLTPGVVFAEEIISRGEVVIDYPLSEDLIVTGGTVVITAEVDGDIFAMGGTIDVDAPVTGDLIVMGGQVDIKGDIEGKIISASGNMILSGSAQKIIMAGGSINIRSGSVIQNYAILAGGGVTNAGRIKGNLYVRTSDFSNTGIVEGNLNLEETDWTEFNRATTFYNLLIKLGFLVFGLVMLRVFEPIFFTIQDEFYDSLLKKGGVGFLLGIASIFIVIFLAITGIGLPFAIFIATFSFLALMISGILVSYTLGHWLATLVSAETDEIGDSVKFIIGFIIVNLIYLVPIAGFFTRIIIIMSLGLGVTFYTVKNNWGIITGNQNR
jgi:hypothetical protein